MGVIYKLKDDVISFIINQKKNNPKVGVRQLSALTSEKFQIEVSKSSVNAVLKNASLSSSVGRRPLDNVRKEKFSIPLNRKSEISKDMQKLGFTKVKESSKEGRKSKANAIEDKKGSEPFEVSKKEENFEKVQIDNALPLLPDPLAAASTLSSVVEGSEEIDTSDSSQEQDFFGKVEQLRNQKGNQKVMVPNGMGFVFLKAAQWEISSKSLISELFRKHIRGSLSGPFDAASDMFLFFKFLGVETFDHIAAYKGHGLWQLNSYCGAIPDENNVLLKLNELYQWDKAIAQDPPSNIVMEYHLEKKHVFSEINGFKIFLEDGSEITMDARMSSFGVSSGNTVCPRDTLPINKAMTWLSNCLISNIQCPVFRNVPGETKFDKVFYDMVTVFENFPGKKILKVGVLNENNELITEFSTIPVQKRTFMIGVDPQQKEFAELTKTVKWAGKKPCYHEGTDRTFYCAETRTDYVTVQFQEKIDDFRVITVWRNKEEDPCWAILTNLEEENSEKILHMYVSRWPYFSEQGKVVSGIEPFLDRERSAAAMSKGCKNIQFSAIFTDYVEALNEYCKRHFFQQNCSKNDINQMLQMVYGISGSIYETKKYIEVFLDVPKTSLYRKDLEYAANRVNQCHIFDHYDRKLWLEI